MAVKWEKTEPNAGVLEIEVEQERVASALDRAFRKAVQRVNVPGFRKGKVPRRIFEARFGLETLYQDALDILLPEAYSTAVQEAKLTPVERPVIDVVQMEAGKPLLFKATVVVKPEVTLGAYRDITYEDKEFAVTEEVVAQELENLRKGHAELRVLEDGQAEAGDLLVMDFAGYVDGEPFEGGEAENYQLELASGTFVPGFEEQLIGVQAGFDREITITFPEGYHVKSLAGKEAKFKVHVHDIKRKALPELDDEFAMDISEFETFDELKADLVRNLERQKEYEHDHYVGEAVLDKVVAEAVVDIPAPMIDHEIDVLVKEFESRLESQGIPLDAYREFTGASMEEIRNPLRDEARKRVKTALVLEAVANAEQIAVSESEVDLEVQKIADSAQMAFDQVKRMLMENDADLLGIKSQIQSRMVMEFLVSHSAHA
ncbi:MAG: trigger factor [Bacilli bacterium]